MTIHDSQQDMRHGYLSGAPGLLVSGTVWLVAASVSVAVSPARALWVLVFGGMMIHPLGLVLTKVLGRPAKHTPDNPLAPLALEGTVWFIAGIALAVVLGLMRIELFFPAMLLLIGGRYLTFQTVYGVRLYWPIGGALLMLGFAAAFLRVPPTVAAAAGGVLEVVAGVVLLRAARRAA